MDLGPSEWESWWQKELITGIFNALRIYDAALLTSDDLRAISIVIRPTNVVTPVLIFVLFVVSHVVIMEVR